MYRATMVPSLRGRFPATLSTSNSLYSSCIFALLSTAVVKLRKTLLLIFVLRPSSLLGLACPLSSTPGPFSNSVGLKALTAGILLYVDRFPFLGFVAIALSVHGKSLLGRSWVNKYDIHLGCDKSRATSVVARGVLGYQSALDQRRFRLLQYRARECNVNIKFGGVVDTPAVSQCTLCPSYCQTTVRRAK